MNTQIIIMRFNIQRHSSVTKFIRTNNSRVPRPCKINTRQLVPNIKPCKILCVNLFLRSYETSIDQESCKAFIYLCNFQYNWLNNVSVASKKFNI